ncbi:hypothetical protein AAHE18_06G070400 [Arachis hypogaea]
MFLSLGCTFVSNILKSFIKYFLEELETWVITTFPQCIPNSWIVGYKMVRKIRVRFAIGIVMVVIFFGTFITHLIEDISWFDSFYMTIITMTVGFGDFSYSTLRGRCFSVISILVSVFTYSSIVLYLISFIVPINSH